MLVEGTRWQEGSVGPACTSWWLYFVCWWDLEHAEEGSGNKTRASAANHGTRPALVELPSQRVCTGRAVLTCTDVAVFPPEAWGLSMFPFSRFYLLHSFVRIECVHLPKAGTSSMAILSAV